MIEVLVIIASFIAGRMIGYVLFSRHIDHHDK